jgi:hypothetical protein
MQLLSVHLVLQCLLQAPVYTLLCVMTTACNTTLHCCIVTAVYLSQYAKLLLDRYRDDHLCFNDDIQGTFMVCKTMLINKFAHSSMRVPVVQVMTRS